MPGYRRAQKAHPTPDAYLDAVREGRLRDSVLSFQMKAGFEPACALPGYAPEDKPSGGHAALMLWHKPLFRQTEAGAQPITRGQIPTWCASPPSS